MSDGDLWALYRSFLAVVREGSLSRAAGALGLSQPTVGRHIEALEAQLSGTPLFTRWPRGLLPTDAARAMLPHIEAMAASAAAARRAVTSGNVLSGVVRITASEIIGAEVLPGILAAQRAQHPDLGFELLLSNRVEDLLLRDSDIAVRMTRPTQGALRAVYIGKTPLGLYAHRNYADRHGLPRTMDELKQHTTIGYDRETPFVKRIAALLKLPRDGFALRVDNDLAVLAALRAGFGLAVCQKRIAARDSDLLPVLPREIAFDLDIWIVMHGDMKGDRRIATTFDHLARGMRAYVKNQPFGLRG